MNNVVDLSKYRGVPPERQIATLFASEKKQAEWRGFKMVVKVDRNAPREYVARVRLYPQTARAKAACKEQGAECIEGSVEFTDPLVVAFALQDAAKAAVELMKDAC